MFNTTTRFGFLFQLSLLPIFLLLPPIALRPFQFGLGLMLPVYKKG